MEYTIIIIATVGLLIVVPRVVAIFAAKKSLRLFGILKKFKTQ